MNFRIGEIADFFGLPASTLRYWEEKGVLHPSKNQENQYRDYTVEDLMTISDILLYKNLGLSLTQIRSMDTASPEAHRQLFRDQLSALDRQEALLRQRRQRLRRRLEAVETLEALRQNPYRETDMDAACIVSFDWLEREKLRRYVENPDLYSRVQHTDRLPEERRGLAVPEDWTDPVPEDQILWRGQSSRYLVFLMREEIAEGFPNDLPAHLRYIQQRHRTGFIISRFLLCARDNGKTCDFYKTYVEILP